MHLLLLAIAPATIIILYIYFKDKFEKEPIPFLFKNFLLGATASVLITVILGGFADRLLPVTNVTNIFQQFVKAFIVVALVEEFSKYVIVKYYAQRNKEYNEPFDGIVYAVMVSMGFATLENVLYVFQHGVSTGILRAFTAVPAHATFAILMGYFMGKAKFSKNRIVLNLTGLLFATLFHGAYDFFLFINFIPGIFIGAFISLGIGILLSKKAIKRHQDNSVFKFLIKKKPQN
ncbi:PrsW family intramembrane metalloprotease [Polaribacter sp. AHE13PA]|jgi:RsiW-degrading membrane proteinase PrsW (M82 family)|uniref:PrsW family intramembrane metalloprotease n=1 Tax=Polaribacter sp. AHE13PA TaxID=2745562 RepID=UPI001C4FC8AD|nr:PrsW family glutamic-type intramembrane protease [Polaribacter sp. AHE13PA]QXP67054.1 PrsW family intramembrane metalloprotease [Polaribacter sp. AHE13PA]